MKAFGPVGAACFEDHALDRMRLRDVLAIPTSRQSRRQGDIMQHRRRSFLIGAACTASALAASKLSFAQAATPLSESDPQAQTLGYKADAAQAGKTKFPKYAAGQMCANCQLYQGKAADATGPCPIFPNKLVASKGWCSAWVKKA